MPVLEPVHDDQAAPAAKDIFEQLNAKLKMVPNIFRTMGHAPDVLGASMKFSASFQAGLDPKLRELAYLKASMVNGCEY